MAESPEDHALRQRIIGAARQAGEANASSGTSQVLANRHLAAVQNQRAVLEAVKADRPDFKVAGGSIDNAIESVNHKIARIEAEIPTLPTHGPADHYYT